MQIKLIDLNFNKLLHYGGREPKDFPVPCERYCISCETAGIFNENNLKLDLMSHAADTECYERILGSIKSREQAIIEKNIMFILEAPGGEYENGQKVLYKGNYKEPPVNGYYFAPSNQELGGEWPNDKNIHKLLERNWYSPYFAYIINKFKLGKVYITNIVKCRINDNGKRLVNFHKDATGKKVIGNCYEEYLETEIKEFNPELIFSFGRKVDQILKEFTKTPIPIECLIHPGSLRSSPHYRYRYQKFITENNNRIEKVLKDLGR